MSETSTPRNAVESLTMQALTYLDPEEKRKVLEYIDSLATLTKFRNEQPGTTENSPVCEGSNG